MSQFASTADYDDYDSLAALVNEHAPKAYELTEITAHAGAEYHTVWLDAESGTVWHAWTTPEDSDTWVLDRETAAEADSWITETLTFALDNLADPERSEDYARRADRVEDDLAALDELEAVRLAGLRQVGADPIITDRLIRSRMDQHRAEIARLSSMRSRNLREAYGDQRGAATAIAAALGVSHETARRTLAAEGEYADRARAGARQAHDDNQ